MKSKRQTYNLPNGGTHLPASKKKRKPVLSHAAMELLKTFQNTTWQLSKTNEAFENFSEHTGCIHCHPYTKTKPGALLVGQRPLLANGGISRCEPAEHVPPSSDGCGGMHS
jgi:hypothetical protein